VATFIEENALQLPDATIRDGRGLAQLARTMQPFDLRRGKMRISRYRFRISRDRGHDPSSPARGQRSGSELFSG
jgi:hypothetical protein